MKKLALLFFLAFPTTGWSAAGRYWNNSSASSMTITETGVWEAQKNTWCAWLRQGPTGDGSTWVDKGAGSPCSFSYIHTSGGAGASTAATINIASDNNQWDSGINVGSWGFECYVYDGTQGSASDRIKLYVNGVLISPFFTGGTIPANIPDTASDVKVGVQTAIASSQHWDGQISHLQSWNKNLSTDEMLELMVHPGAVTGSLLGWWPVYGEDSPELDRSGNGRNGTIVGTSASQFGPPRVHIPGGL